MTMAITGYYLGTVDGGESKFGTQKKFIVLNKCVNVVLISHVICHMASFFLRKILNNWQTGNGPGKERNQVIISFILNIVTLKVKVYWEILQSIQGYEQ